jgi:N-acetylmuramoyl-L-alanine amidase
MKIMIDPGHGGKDPGACANDLREKDLTLTLALRVGELLMRRGAEVHFTRAADDFVGLSERARMANDAGVDYFLSVHINAGGGTGFESYTYLGTSGETERIRSVIHDHVAAVFASAGLPDRGQKQANFAVLRETRMPAVLLEYGFIDNAGDSTLLQDPDWLERLAQATADGVAEAFGLTEPPQSEASEDEGEGKVSDWRIEFAQACAWAVERGITDGTRPKDPVTREEVWTMLYRALK